ncbi:hypothetical protein DFH06DRAFT_467015 [Mycena polygramma]|nr:hypothetical protein DFH06DRAFT_467015 [Mycena polygramma]
MATDTLPVELLQKIFKSTLYTREEAIEKGRISFLDSPWSLTLVSSRWRTVALGMPCLWASVTIAIKSSSPSWVNYPLGLVEAQLSRSGTHPLHVVLISEEEPAYTTEKLFKLISQSSDRWETLYLDSVRPLGHALHRIRDKLSLLREMYICTQNATASSDVFRSAPNLRIAHIIDPKETDEFDDRVHRIQRPGDKNLELPWAQLTVFESTYRDRLQFEGMLLATNLVECQITVPFRDLIHFPWRAPAQSTVFPHLRRLVLQAPVIYLDALCLPALEALQIRTSSPFDQLVHMLQRSGCSLKRFWMRARPPVEQFLALLMHNAQIFELGILGTRLDGPIANTDAIINALTLRGPDGPQQPVYAPALTSLTIREKSEKVDMKALFDMVESRVRFSHLHGCSRLETFCVLGGGDRIYEPDFMERLAALYTSGLHIEFKPNHDQELTGTRRARAKLLNLRYI